MSNKKWTQKLKEKMSYMFFKNIQYLSQTYQVLILSPTISNFNPIQEI